MNVLFFTLFCTHLPLFINAEKVLFNIIDDGNRPNADRYKVFYEQNRLQFMSDPQSPLQKASKVDFYILSAPLSKAFTETRKIFTSGHKDDVDEHSMTHNGIGFLGYDSNGVEIGRVSASFWAARADRADYPYLVNSSRIQLLNRAITAYTQSKNDWEGGYWTDNQLIQTLTPAENQKAWKNVKEFAVKHPYLAGNEIWSADKELLSPAVTCNSFVQHMVSKVAGKDVFASQILHVGYSVIVLNEKKEKMENQERQMSLFNFWTPRFYNEHGDVIVTEDTPVVYMYTPKKFYMRSNVKKDMDFFPMLHMGFGPNLGAWRPDM